MKVCEVIPFKKFKEKIRIVKELERSYKNAAIEMHKNLLLYILGIGNKYKKLE